MSIWNPNTFDQMGKATELDLASRSAGGSLSARTTMWVVPVDGDLYVRSAYGPDSAWYRRALAAQAGHVWAGGADADVRLVPVDPSESDLHAAIDTAYHRKYDQYGPRIVGSVVGGPAAQVTVRLQLQPLP